MKLQHSSRVDTLPQVTSPTAGSRAQDPSRRRILIVEDDYLVALQFENALTEAGYDVVDIASTAEEAVQLVPDRKPARRPARRHSGSCGDSRSIRHSQHFHLRLLRSHDARPRKSRQSHRLAGEAGSRSKIGGHGEHGVAPHPGRLGCKLRPARASHPPRAGSGGPSSRHGPELSAAVARRLAGAPIFPPPAPSRARA